MAGKVVHFNMNKGNGVEAAISYGRGNYCGGECLCYSWKKLVNDDDDNYDSKTTVSFNDTVRNPDNVASNRRMNLNSELEKKGKNSPMLHFPVLY
jgi:hypothetical protein